jgi:hypothetical protein
VLIRELEAARGLITDERVAKLGQQMLDSARKAGWAPAVTKDIESSNRRLTAADILAHLELVIDLARRAHGNAHTYLKFYGD